MWDTPPPTSPSSPLMASLSPARHLSISLRESERLRSGEHTGSGGGASYLTGRGWRDVEGVEARGGQGRAEGERPVGGVKMEGGGKG